MGSSLQTLPRCAAWSSLLLLPSSEVDLVEPDSVVKDTSQRGRTSGCEYYYEVFLQSPLNLVASPTPQLEKSSRNARMCNVAARRSACKARISSTVREDLRPVCGAEKEAQLG